jgi:hypothetical protein
MALFVVDSGIFPLAIVSSVHPESPDLSVNVTDL